LFFLHHFEKEGNGTDLVDRLKFKFKAQKNSKFPEVSGVNNIEQSKKGVYQVHLF